MLLVSELTWSIDSFLNLSVLGWELLNLSFYSILHEMLRLWGWGLWVLSIVDICVLESVEVWWLFFLVRSRIWASHLNNCLLAWKLRWRLHTDTSSTVSRIIKLRDCLQFSIVWILLLDPRCSSGISEVVMHYLPSFSLSLNTSSSRHLVACIY